MKTALVITLVVSTLISVVEAKSLIGKVEKYIYLPTNEVIEIGSNAVSDDGKEATYFNHASDKELTISMSDVSKSTRERISGVRAGESILATTYILGSNTSTVSRFCLVYAVFENKQAQVGCKYSGADYLYGGAVPNILTFIIKNVENVTAEVQELDNFKSGEVAKLKNRTLKIKAGKDVKIVALYANGEALIQRNVFNILNGNSILYKPNLERVLVSDLEKLTESRDTFNSGYAN